MQNKQSFIEKLANRIINIVLLGFSWFLVSIPIVTIGGACTAMNVAMKSYLYEENQKPVAVFFNAFKKHWKLATQIWLLHIAAFGILAWDLIYYRTGTDTFSVLGATVMAVMLMMVLLELTIVFIAIPEYDLKTIKESFHKAMDLAFTCFFESLSLSVLVVAVCIVCFTLLPSLLTTAAGIISYLQWQIIPKMLRKYKFSGHHSLTTKDTDS